MTSRSISMRATLAGAFTLVGVLAVGLALIAGSIYQELTFESQRESLAKLVQLKSDEIKTKLLQDARQLGISVQSGRAFKEAQSAGVAFAVADELEQQFSQWLGSARHLKLAKLAVFDRNLEVVAEAAGSEGALAVHGLVCPRLLNRVRQRQGVERLMLGSEICLHQGRPLLSLLSAMDLKAQSYLQVVVDPAFSLRQLESELQMPVRIEQLNGAVLYRSADWASGELQDQLLHVTQEFVTSSAEPALLIHVANSVQGLHEKLAYTRLIIIAIAIVLTAAVIGLVLLLLQRMTFNPINRLNQQVRRVSEDKAYLGEEVSVEGNTEVRVLAINFNAMTNKLQHLYARLEEMAFTDSLTDLPNRALFNERAENIVTRSRERSSNFALMIMDLDRFKDVNDALGHDYGDKLLQVVGQRLRGCIRAPDLLVGYAGDTVARLGGDEFATVLPSIQTEEEAAQVAQRICEEVGRPIKIEDHTFHIGISIGLVLYPRDGKTSKELIKNADLAMYHAKKNQYQYAFFDKRQDEHKLQKLMLASELRAAILQEQLDLNYQPKIDLRSGVVCGVEALVRWTHPEYGVIAPDKFIELAEATGLIHPLTLLVLRKALFQCAAWHREGIKIGIAVNLSALSLQDPTLIREVASALASSGLEPAYLSLELTESAVMADPVGALSQLVALDEMGVKLSVDDFGTGYSSLAYLKRLPVDEIKIDRAFVMEIQQDRQDVVIVSSTIDLGHNMGMQVIAEGIEDRNTYERLLELGCDMGQGYYMGKPMSAEEFVRWLATSPWGLSGSPQELNARVS